MSERRRFRLVPGIAVARGYRRSWLGPDLVAGVVLTGLLIPAGMGYATAAGLPPETGLYATVVPLCAYALLGPSRILVLGPDSALAPIIAASVLPLAAGDPDRAVALAGLFAVMMGVVLVVAGVLRLGFVTDLLSAPIRLGYLNGIALVVVVSQVPALLGFSAGGDDVLSRVGPISKGLADGLATAPAAWLGLGSLALILGLRLAGTRMAGVLVAVAGSMAVVAAAGWQDTVPVVGALPQGLPAPALGGLKWSDVASLALPAVGIALIAFADTAVLSRTFAARRGESVDGSDEMRGIGLANVAGGLMGGFPVSGSSSRTPVADQAGARTQLAAVVGAGLILVFIVAVPGLTAYLPSATLAAVVIVAAGSLIDVPAVVRLVRMDRVDGLLSLAAFAGVVVVGVLPGILIVVALSFVAFVNRSWRPYRAQLGRVPGMRGYHDLDREPGARRVPGLVIVRFDAPLFFANGGMFDDWVRSVVDRSDDDVHTVVLAAEPITDIDTTAVRELVELDDYLTSRGITLVIAEMKRPVRDLLDRYGVGDRFGDDRFQPTVGAAVDAATGHVRYDLEGEDAARSGGDTDDRHGRDHPEQGTGSSQRP